MKRSVMLRKITRLLKTWECSKLTGKTSKQILDLVEKEGMLPPNRWKLSARLPGHIIERDFQWEPESGTK